MYVNAILDCREQGKFIPMLAMSFARRSVEVYVKHAERAAGELCRELSAGGSRVTLLTEYGEEALRSASADEKYYVTAKGVRKI